MTIGTIRLAELQSAFDLLENAIASRAKAGSPALEAANRIFPALKSVSTKVSTCPPHRLPVCDQIDEAISAIGSDQAESLALARAIKTLDPLLGWYRRTGLADAAPAFADGHANAVLAGPKGLEERNDVWMGVSLMAPGLTYPNHNHPPEEVYAVLSPGFWRQNSNPWVEPGIGGIVYNPPNIFHAMRSADTPLLAVWCLWLGESA